MVPQQWIANTTAPGVSADERRRLDLAMYGATLDGVAMCCDAMLVAPLNRALPGRPTPGTAARDGAALNVARRRKLERYSPSLAGGVAAALRARCRGRRPLEQRLAAACSPLRPVAGTTGATGLTRRGLGVGALLVDPVCHCGPTPCSALGACHSGPLALTISRSGSFWISGRWCCPAGCCFVEGLGRVREWRTAEDGAWGKTLRYLQQLTLFSEGRHVPIV